MNLEDLLEGVRAGDRRRLARAVTLTESTLPAHRELASELLEKLSDRMGGARRIGVTGPPGAGKSTLIEALGLHALEHGQRVAVLAIDPTSENSGGSILGDKTRMEQLSLHADAFVRPTPAGLALGGVARRTRECVGLFEAAGFTTILVETVGVGQSETAVSHLVDTVLLVALPGAGDELQGIKRGLMETADVVFLNKAEGDRQPLARQAASQYSAALRLLPPRTPGWAPPVLLGSALEGLGIAELWSSLEKHAEHVGPHLAERRSRQSLYWFERLLQERLLERFLAGAELGALREQVARGELTPERAVARALSKS